MYGLLYINDYCPWCGERLELSVDPVGEDREYVEDCQVCCSPILVSLRYELGVTEQPEVILARDNE